MVLNMAILLLGMAKRLNPASIDGYIYIYSEHNTNLQIAILYSLLNLNSYFKVLFQTKQAFIDVIRNLINQGVLS